MYVQLDAWFEQYLNYILHIFCDGFKVWCDVFVPNYLFNGLFLEAIVMLWGSYSLRPQQMYCLLHLNVFITQKKKKYSLLHICL